MTAKRIVFIFSLLSCIAANAQWTLVDVGTDQDINSVQYLNSTTIILGSDNDMIRSDDGGQSWNSLPMLDINGNTLFHDITNDLHFINPSTGIAVGINFLGNQEVILRTQDSGVSWSAVSIYEGGAHPRNLNEVHFFNSTTGICVGTNGRILRSTNSGQSWTAVTSGTTRELHSVHFYNSTNGIIVGDEVILTTSNGGTSWTLQNHPGRFLKSVRTLSSTLAYTCGNVIMKSTNNGAAWTVMDEIDNCRDVHITDADSAYIAFDGLLKTTNAGAYWGPQSSAPVGMYNDIEFLTTTSGYAVGQDGLVVKTETGGETLPQLDAGMLDIQPIAITVCEGEFPINVRIQNFGQLALTSANVHWSLNGVEQETYAWTGLLTTQESSSYILLGTATIGLDDVVIEAWITEPNGGTDAFSLNNAATLVEVSNRMHGTYTVGGTNPDYLNPASFAQALGLNGLCGPVEVVVRDGTYTGAFNPATWVGGGQDAVLTIRSESGNSAGVVFQNTANLGRLDGNSYVRFENITFSTTGGWVWEIKNNAQQVDFVGCRFIGSTTLATQTLIALNTTTPDFIRFTDCTFLYGGIGLSLPGSTNDYMNGLEITNCVFENQRATSVALKYVNAPILRGNEITSTLTDVTVTGIKLENAQGATVVSHNHIKIDKAVSGILMLSCNDQNATNAQVFNNIVRCNIPGSSGTPYAIDIRFSYRVHVVHNTVRTTGVAVRMGSTANTVGYGCVLMNNIMDCTSPGGVGQGIGIPFQLDGPSFIDIEDYDVNTYFDAFGYNVFYTPGNIIARGISEDFYSLNAWKNFFTPDVGSVSCSGQFAGLDDWEIIPNSQNYQMANLGIPVDFVTVDFNNTPRGPNPDPGAHEWESPMLDGALFSLSHATLVCEGASEIKVRLANYGQQTITQALIAVTLDGVSLNNVSWNGLLAPGDSTEYISLGTLVFSVGAHTFECALVQCNGVTDLLPANNTISVALNATGVSGVLTIGGANPDFVSVQEAVSSIVSTGICGPVTFNIRPGIYQEQITMNEVPGASEYNRIVFQAESGDSSSVIIQFNGTGTTNGFVFKLNNADYVTFNRISMRSTLADSHILHLVGSCDYVELEHCHLGIPTINNDQKAAVYFSGIVEVQSFTAHACRVEGKTYAFQTAQSQPDARYYDFEISHCILFNQRDDAFRLLNPYHAQLHHNHIESTTMIGSARTGIDVYGWEQVSIHHNTIVGGYSDGITVVLTNSGANSPSYIYNNMYVSQNSESGFGINCIGTSIHVVSNTVLMHSIPAEPDYALYLSNCIGCVAVNNILAIDGEGRCIDLGNLSSTVTSDYNYMYCEGTGPFSAGVNYASLAAWQTGTGRDLNSHFAYPQFVSDTDAHLSGDLIADGAGTGLFSSMVTTDIDDELRMNPPDIGADEYINGALALDAALVQIVNPLPICPGVGTVQIAIGNLGTTTLNSLSIGWSVNGEEQPTVEWTGSLASQDETFVELGSVDFQVAAVYEIEAWIMNPNGQQDQNATNDGDLLTDLHTQLSGDVVIGSGFFYENMQSLIDDIALYGVCGPVIANVYPGQHPGFVIPQLEGLDAVNTLTIQSLNGTSGSVEFSVPVASGAIIDIVGGDFLSLERISIIAEPGEDAIRLSGGSNAISIIETIIEGDVISTGDTDNDFHFEYNEVTGSLVLNGEITEHETGAQVLRNRFTNGRVYVAYSDLVVVRENGIVGDLADANAIELMECENFISVHSNRIEGNGMRGIVIDALGSVDEHVEVINNSVTHAGMGAGIQLSESSAFVDVIFNTVKGESGESLVVLNGSEIRFINNLLVTDAGSLIDVISETSVTDCHHNNYFSDGGFSAVIEGQPFFDFAQFQLETGLGDQSSTLNPLFNEAQMWYVNNAELIGTAVTWPGVSGDIMGNSRDALSPTMGAFELPSILVQGDIDGDGQVSTLDLLTLVGNYGCVGDDCLGDLDGDGVVTVLDLIILISSMN